MNIESISRKVVGEYLEKSKNPISEQTRFRYETYLVGLYHRKLDNCKDFRDTIRQCENPEMLVHIKMTNWLQGETTTAKTTVKKLWNLLQN